MTKDFNSCIQDIIVCLIEQNSLIIELVKISQNQVEALKVDNIQELNDIAIVQERLGRSLALQEKKRRELVRKMVPIIGKEDIKMSDVITASSNNDRVKLQDLTESLVLNQLKLQETHELSRMLLKQSIQYVQKMMDCIEPNRLKTYGSSGQVDRTEISNAINRSV
ncbi:MAG: hypothetical protein APF76_02340 [Desulfitibacter sp. BRH_c19]|nr:MAG: hypothetical protein APF76_02340 [Desulfitibacter sp. BRH_c19]